MTKLVEFFLWQKRMQMKSNWLIFLQCASIGQHIYFSIDFNFAHFLRSEYDRTLSYIWVSTVCPPVAELPPRKFGQLFFWQIFQAESEWFWAAFSTATVQVNTEKIKHNILSLIFSSWNSQYTKNRNYQT